MAEDKTFTQEEVNNIVSKRLAEERVKLEAGISQKQQELARKELELSAKSKLKDEGIDVSVLDYLKFDDEETLNKAIGYLKGLKPNNNPPQNNKPVIVRGNTGGGGGEHQDPIRKAMGLK